MSGDNVLTRRSVKMYKTRIREWHLQRNYKAQEKQAVLDVLKRVELSATSRICFEIRGRPVKMDRIFRYSRVSGRADADKVAPSHLALGTKQRKTQISELYDTSTREQLIHALSPPVPLFSLSAPQDLQGAEIIMYETAQYYRSYFSPKDRFNKPDLLRWQPFFGQSILGDIVDQYVNAWRAARISKYKTARIFLDRVHRQLHLAMLAEHSQLIGTIFEVLYTRSGNANFETTELFGRFAADMSTAIHGENHPITKSVQRFCHSMTWTDGFLDAFDQMRMTTAREILGDMHGETILLKVALCYGMREPENQKRDVLLAEALESAECNYGHCHDLTLRVLLDRAGFYLRGMDDLAMAESGLEEVVRRCQESSADRAMTCAKLKALKGLLTVASIRQCWDVSESLCREALAISIEELGHDHYYTKGLAESLVDSLWEQGRVDQAREWAKFYRLEIEAEL